MRIKSTGFFIVLCLALIFGLAACQEDGTAEKAGQRIDNTADRTGQSLEKIGDTIADKAEQAGEYMDDAAITTKVKAEILSDPLLKVAQIEVTTTDGVVKLSGTVDSQQSIDRAVQIARNLENVKSVDNALVR